MEPRFRVVKGRFTLAWTLLARLIVLFTALPVHEFAHAYASARLGDDTPARERRLTLNPLRHLDMLGSMSLLLLGFGWAKPVMVDPRNYKNPRAGMAITALAGPSANILMAVAALILCKLVYISGTGMVAQSVFTVLGFIVTININLAVFNLLPVPPLDGSKILGFFLPRKIYSLFLRYDRIFMLVLMLLLWRGYLNGPILFLADKLFYLLDTVTPPFGMFR